MDKRFDGILAQSEFDSDSDSDEADELGFFLSKTMTISGRAMGGWSKVYNGVSMPGWVLCKKGDEYFLTPTAFSWKDHRYDVGPFPTMRAALAAARVIGKNYDAAK